MKGYIIFDGPIKSIPDGAFAAFEKLTKVTIPGTVETIGEEAFKGCTYLGEFTMTPPPISIIPNNTNNGLTIKDSAFEGCELLSSLELNADEVIIESIGDSAFKNTSIEELKFDDSKLTYLGAHAFEGCDKLKKIELTDAKITNLNAYIFKDCTELKTVELPETIEDVELNAFNGCTITSVSFKGVVYDKFNKLYKGLTENEVNVKIDNLDQVFMEADPEDGTVLEYETETTDRRPFVETGWGANIILQ